MFFFIYTLSFYRSILTVFNQCVQSIETTTLYQHYRWDFNNKTLNLSSNQYCSSIRHRIFKCESNINNFQCYEVYWQVVLIIILLSSRKWMRWNWLPFADLAVTPYNAVLDVNRMIPQSTHHDCLVKSANNEHSVMSLWQHIARNTCTQDSSPTHCFVLGTLTSATVIIVKGVQRYADYTMTAKQ